jgi:uncharacterized membrane protein YphA (DoxX/SURF4 family)
MRREGAAVMSREHAVETATSAVLCVMRAVMGVVLGAHAIGKLLQLPELQGELLVSGLPQPELSALAIVALELAAALMLLVGRHLRLAGLATLCDAVIAIVLIMLQHRALELHLRLESAALMGAAAFYLMTASRRMFIGQARSPAAGSGAASSESLITDRENQDAAELTYSGAHDSSFARDDSRSNARWFRGMRTERITTTTRLHDKRIPGGA